LSNHGLLFSCHSLFDFGRVCKFSRKNRVWKLYSVLAQANDLRPDSRNTREARWQSQRKDHMASKLFVGNLPFTTTENDLQDHFAQAGAVLAVNIMQDRATGRSRGFAFVEMASQEDATKAISMFHQKDFQGRPLTVNEARPREDRPPGGGGGGGGGYRGGRGGGGGGGGGGGRRDWGQR
jgi:RNA recognition motif-containing protein